MPPLNPSPLSPAGPTPVDVLVLCSDIASVQYRSPLRSLCHVATTQSASAVLDYAVRSRPSLLILDDEQHDGMMSICQRLREGATTPSSILITLSQPEKASDVIDVCNSILLKPFAPNLLSARVGRLLRLQQGVHDARDESAGSWEQAEHEPANGAHLPERQTTGTLVQWPTEHCPHCNTNGIVQFDHASQHRAWYACPSCRKVWIARRRN